MGTLYLVVLKLGAKTGIHFRSPGPISCSSGSPSTSSECWPPPHTSSTSSSSTPQQRGRQMPQGKWPINRQNTFLLIYRAIWLFPILNLWYGILYKLLRIQQLTAPSLSLFGFGQILVACHSCHSSLHRAFQSCLGLSERVSP